MKPKRTRFLVKILCEERIPAHDNKQELALYNMNYVSEKYCCDCPGLQKEIRDLLWTPFYEEFFSGGRYFKTAIVKRVGVDESYLDFPKKKNRRRS